MKYNRLTIIDTFMKMMPNGKRRRYANCKCDCGVVKEVAFHRVRDGVTKSCGCLSRELTTERNTKHGYRYHPAYDTYNSMMARCYNPKNQNYSHYGGRGIGVADVWHDVKVFAEWCERNGFRKDYQLDRIDNDGDYSPDNCRFVTPTVNLRNTRRNVVIEGVSLREFLDELGEKHNIGHPTLRYRYYTITKEGLPPNEHNLIFHKRWSKKTTS